MWAESSRGKNVKAVIKIYFVHGILQIRWIHDTILRKCVLFHPQPWMGEPFLYQVLVLVKITVQLSRNGRLWFLRLEQKIDTVLYCTKISTKTGVLPFFFSLYLWRRWLRFCWRKEPKPISECIWLFDFCNRKSSLYFVLLFCSFHYRKRNCKR